jgi:hypothetical protein
MLRVFKFLIVLAAALLAVVPLPPAIVERTYSRGFYPVVQPHLTELTNQTSVALFDPIVLAALAGIVTLGLVRLRRRRGGIGRTLGYVGLDTAVICAVLYLWFLAAWGLNYRREPLREQLDFREDRITRDALRELALKNTHVLNTLYRDAHAEGWPPLDETARVLQPAFARAQQDLGLTWTAAAGLPKRTLFNFYFTRVSIDGMTNPFLLETLANQTLLPFERAATVAHEWSHLAGYADESEANFVGWLVCMRGTPAIQYSGWLALYGTATNALARSDREEIVRQLEQGPRADLVAIAERVRSQVNPVFSRAGYAMYDRFLKANRVEAGIRSYSEVLRLLLGTRFTEDGVPIRRY